MRRNIPEMRTSRKIIPLLIPALLQSAGLISGLVFQNYTWKKKKFQKTDGTSGAVSTTLHTGPAVSFALLTHFADLLIGKKVLRHACRRRCRQSEYKPPEKTLTVKQVSPILAFPQIPCMSK
jgi:hypothetical protein